MKKPSQKTHWWIDLGLLLGYLFSFYLELTGLWLHQWLGVGVTILALIHLVLHWDWVVCVFTRFFSKTSGRSRVYLLLDILIMIGAVLIFETGLVISTWFNLDLSNYLAFLDIHVHASIITLGLTLLKLGLHWRWISSTLKKMMSTPTALRLPLPGQPVAIPVPVDQKQVDRRQFLAIMGAVGGASALAAANLISYFRNAQTTSIVQAAEVSTDVSQVQAPAAVPTAAPQTSVTQSATAVPTPTPIPQVAYSQTTASCTVRCPRGCSYPGHCRRYTDSNQNRKCDLGECL